MHDTDDFILQARKIISIIVSSKCVVNVTSQFEHVVLTYSNLFKHLFAMAYKSQNTKHLAF
jgi:hypothetical protein